MTPVRTSPPVDRPVDIAAVKAHCRVTHDHEDDILGVYLDAAVSHLDGWDGQLGRCIMVQTWTVELPAGWQVLPMPDVTAAVASYEDAITETLAVTPTALGPAVSMAAAGEVEFTCEMPALLLPRVRVIILQMVGLWYANRETAVADNLHEVPGAAQLLIDGLRWRQL